LEVHRVPALQLHPQPRVPQHRPADEGAVLVADLAFPGIVDPMRRPVHPHTETEGMALGVVLQPDAREVNVSNLIKVIEIDEVSAVAQNQRSRHDVTATSLWEPRARGPRRGRARAPAP